MGYRHRRRRNAQRVARNRIYALSALTAVFFLTFWIIGALRRPAADPAAVVSATQAATAVAAEASESQPADQPTPTSTPSATPTAARPAPDASGMMPILSTIKNDQNMIAITVDDCFQMDNVQEIVALCEQLGVKVTFFPVARGIKNNPAAWRDIYEKGFQIENHTYRHTDLLKLDEETIEKEIVEINKLLNKTLGVNYHMRFLRTMGGNARRDGRVHRIMYELGYDYMAHWSLSGSNTKTSLLPDKLKSGQIILFHANDSDLRKLKTVLPEAVARGFQLVTLNELMGLPPNLVTPLEADVEGTQVGNAVNG